MENLADYLPVSVKDKNILVTGGTTGIGRAAAILLASCGARVFVFGRHKKELDETMKELKETGNRNVSGMVADVSDVKKVIKVFQRFDTKFGPIDVLINNAAIGYRSVLDGSHDDREYLLSTNINGYLACAHEAAKRMKENGSGHILNIGSMSAEVREEGGSMYVATKSAIQGFSASLRKELNPHNIKVTLIEPGSVATEIHNESPEKLRKKVKAEEMLDAKDIAGAILYCLSQPNRCNIVSLQIKPLMQKI